MPPFVRGNVDIKVVNEKWSPVTTVTHPVVDILYPKMKNGGKQVEK